jgi:hypothetical protein
LLGNSSVNTFPKQQRIIGGVTFCAVRAGSKKVGDCFFQKLPDILEGFFIGNVHAAAETR